MRARSEEQLQQFGKEYLETQSFKQAGKCVFKGGYTWCGLETGTPTILLQKVTGFYLPVTRVTQG